MAKHRVCPWWIGYLLASPIRRWYDDSVGTINSHVREGMTVLEPGPGMGFFTLEMARRVGPSGRVIAPDIQPKMVSVLKRRARKAGLAQRVDARLVGPDSLGVADLSGQVDFALACAMVHELEAPSHFFEEVAHALKPGGRMLIVEPKGHVHEPEWQAELDAAARYGLRLVERREFRRNLAALVAKS
jgi:ubiquinone/menaquinone biosynthesis C-methylase UbiE